MATSTTLQTIAEEIIHKLFDGEKFVVETTAASGGSTTNPIILNKGYASLSANVLDGCGLWVVGITAPQQCWVNRGGYAVSSANASLTTSPALGATPNSSKAAWFTYNLTRADILNAVNRILGSLKMDTYLPLTMVTDGDLEANNVTSWTSVGTPTVKAKVTTAANVLMGQRSLHVTTDTLSHGVTTAGIDVDENEQLLLSVAIQCPTGSVAVTLYDNTAGAAIKTVTVDERNWTEIRFQEAVPDNCESVTVRILSATASSDWYVGWVSLLSQQRYVYNLPSSVVDASDLDEKIPVYAAPLGQQSEDSDSFMALATPFEPHPVEEALRDYLAANSQRIVLATRPSFRPLFLKFRRAYPDLSADTDTTAVPEQAVVQGALQSLYYIMADKNPNQKEMGRLRALGDFHGLAYKRELAHYGVGKPIAVREAQRRVYSGE